MRPSDLQLLGLEVDADGRHSRFVLTPALSRHDGALYGGTAIAVSAAAIEAAVGRDVLWVTTQFVSLAQLGSTIDVETEVMAEGRRTAQLRVTGRVAGEVVFASLGAAAVPRVDGLAGQFETMPEVARPDEVEPTDGLRPPAADGAHIGFRALVEQRQVAVAARPGSQGTMAMWARLLAPDAVMTPAAVAFLADMVPVAIARGAGKQGAGTSLDNTMRFGPAIDSEWVLLELQGHLASGGYGHGTVHVWTEDGRLVATGSQTANMTHIFGDLPG